MSVWNVLQEGRGGENVPDSAIQLANTAAGYAWTADKADDVRRAGRCENEVT